MGNPRCEMQPRMSDMPRVCKSSCLDGCIGFGAKSSGTFLQRRDEEKCVAIYAWSRR